MPKVGLVGPYSPAMKEAFYDSLPQDYEAVEVTATDDYKNLADVDYIINRTLPIDETLLSICPKLKLSQNMLSVSIILMLLPLRSAIFL